MTRTGVLVPCLRKVCQDNRIPFFAADVDSVTRWAVPALVVDCYQLGRMTGAMARKILFGELTVSDLPVQDTERTLPANQSGAGSQDGEALPEAVVTFSAWMIR
jgi:putative tryptophan/tyrosine transport system substrate-binding protein